MWGYEEEARRRDADLCFALPRDAGRDAGGCNRLHEKFNTDRLFVAVLRAEDIVRSAIRRGIPAPSEKTYRRMVRYATLRACGEYWVYLSRFLEW